MDYLRKIHKHDMLKTTDLRHIIKSVFQTADCIIVKKKQTLKSCTFGYCYCLLIFVSRIFFSIDEISIL